MENSSQEFKVRAQLNSWEKAYWYLRLLVNSDRYGNLAKDAARIKTIQEHLLAGYARLKESDDDDETKKSILNSILEQTLFNNMQTNTQKYLKCENLFYELDNYFKAPKDYFVFGIVIKEILIPTNTAVKSVPTTECADFARVYARALLTAKKEKALSNLVREWDIITEDIALNREREILISLFRNLKLNLGVNLKELNENISDIDLDMVLTATCQEFERRVGQKRKQRAGEDLENLTDFILDYFNFECSDGPEHFTAGLEIDNWLKDSRGWYIGISLKRTLRERWKQTYTTEIGLYDRYKIKYILHIVNNDSDLSDSKITEMGAYRHLFFLADNSNKLNEIKDHVALGKYVFPMSSLVEILRKLID